MSKITKMYMDAFYALSKDPKTRKLTAIKYGINPEIFSIALVTYFLIVFFLSFILSAKLEKIYEIDFASIFFLGLLVGFLLFPLFFWIASICSKNRNSF